MSDKENKELRKLININEDACEFYETAQKHAESQDIRTTFRNLESLHKGVLINLQERVRANGGEAEADETFAGQARKLWGDLMAHISNDVDETLVKHLEEAEDRCLHSMEDALESQDIHPSTKMVLQNELASLQKSHDYMKALKETMSAA